MLQHLIPLSDLLRLLPVHHHFLQKLLRAEWASSPVLDAPQVGQGLLCRPALQRCSSCCCWSLDWKAPDA